MSNIDLLLDVGSFANYRKNQVVFMEGDAGTDMYIALKGAFGVYAESCTGFTVKVSDIKPSSFFGEMAAVDNWPRSATVIAEEDSTALLINNDKLLTVFEKSPDIADSIVNMLKKRTDETAKKARSSGQNIPALPVLPSGLGSAQEKMIVMAALSRQIRLMNKLLLGKMTLKTQPTKGEQVTLLPVGYKPIGKTDVNDNEDMLWERTIYCPCCNMQQTAFVPSRFNLPQTKYTPDGRVIYRDFNILLYTNIICSNCNYADSYQEFLNPVTDDDGNLHDGIQFPNTEGFKGFAETHAHTADEAVLSYYLQLHCLETVTSDPLRFAKAWIRLYWLYSDYQCNDLARQAATKAKFYYTKYLDDNKASMEEHAILVTRKVLAALSASIRQ